jgi:hypothetical protein
MPSLQCFVDGILLPSLGFWASINLLIFRKKNTMFHRINLVPASDGNMREGVTCLDVSGKKNICYSLVEISLFSVINDL